MPSPPLPKPWQILQKVQTQLATITQVNGYRTDIGNSVSLEREQNDADMADRITLFSTGLAPGNAEGNQSRVIKYRDFEFVIEAEVPATMAVNGVVVAHQHIHEIVEDIEQAFAPYFSVGTTDNKALPISFADAVFLDRPAGLPVIAVQYVVSTRYRR